MSDNYKRTTGRYRPTETDFHPPPTGHGDWQVELVRFLISGGTNGRTQNQIVIRLQNWVDSKTVEEELITMQVERKVDKFIPPSKGKGRTPIIWRATTKLME